MRQRLALIAWDGVHTCGEWTNRGEPAVAPARTMTAAPGALIFYDEKEPPRHGRRHSENAAAKVAPGEWVGLCEEIALRG